MIADLLDRGAPIADIAAALHALDPDARRAAVIGLGRGHQRALYERAATAAPLTLHDLVPADVPDLQPVPHRGWNTLPVPRFGKRFTKWMTRSRGEVVGYNDSPFGWLIGPGYFVIAEHQGALVVDYYRVPSGPVPEGWPWVRPNWLGLQLFVYGHTRDVLRRVSEHVSIGAAYKYGIPVGSWFVLVRE